MEECWAVSQGGGFAPAPPGFSASVPVPMRGLDPQVMEKGCHSIPPRSVEATESALGLLPSSEIPDQGSGQSGEEQVAIAAG